MTPKDVLSLLIALVFIGIILYLFFWYVDSMMKEQHNEHSCHMGLDDNEIKEIEDK